MDLLSSSLLVLILSNFAMDSFLKLTLNSSTLAFRVSNLSLSILMIYANSDETLSLYFSAKS